MWVGGAQILNSSMIRVIGLLFFKFNLTNVLFPPDAWTTVRDRYIGVNMFSAPFPWLGLPDEPSMNLNWLPADFTRTRLLKWASGVAQEKPDAVCIGFHRAKARIKRFFKDVSCHHAELSIYCLIFTTER